MNFINIFTLILVIVGGLNWVWSDYLALTSWPPSSGLARGSPGSFTSW